MLPHHRGRVLAVLLLPILAACGSDKAAGPTTGSLIVNVTTPTGIAGAVMVSGPGSYSKTVTATDTLRGLTAGNYTIVAANASSSDTIVSTLYAGAVTGSPATVTTGGTASAAAVYTARTGSGELWYGSWLGTSLAVGYASPSLAATGTPTPTDTIGTGGVTTHKTSAMAFDASGNLWLADFADDTIREFTAAQLAGGVSTPATKIALAIEAPTGLAFDAAGDLWVSFSAVDSVAEFDAATLASAAGTVAQPTPALELWAPGFPVGLAFDASNNLWVAEYLDSTVYEFPPSHLVSGGTPTDSLKSVALSRVSGLAFDAGGDLWGATEAGLLVEYDAAVVTSATPATTPSQTVTLPAAADAVVFDNSGNLWTTTEATPAFYALSPAQLQTGGAPTPTKIITAIGGESFALAFDPHAGGLPLAGLRAPALRGVRNTPHSAARITAHSHGTPNLVGHAQPLSGYGVRR